MHDNINIIMCEPVSVAQWINTGLLSYSTDRPAGRGFKSRLGQPGMYARTDRRVCLCPPKSATGHYTQI